MSPNVSFFEFRSTINQESCFWKFIESLFDEEGEYLRQQGSVQGKNFILDNIRIDHFSQLTKAKLKVDGLDIKSCLFWRTTNDSIVLRLRIYSEEIGCGFEATSTIDHSTFISFFTRELLLNENSITNNFLEFTMNPDFQAIAPQEEPRKIKSSTCSY